jgi:hypothetical protein
VGERGGEREREVVVRCGFAAVDGGQPPEAVDLKGVTKIWGVVTA